MADGITPTSCMGKESYATVGLARAVLKRRRNAVRSRKGKGGSLAVYRCHHCGEFHIGGAPRTVHVEGARTLGRQEFRRID